MAEGQEHLFAGWAPPGRADDAKRRLLDQLHHLDRNYAGGLCKYIQNARKLLRDSKEGARPPRGLPSARGLGWLPPNLFLPSPRAATDRRRQPL